MVFHKSLSDSESPQVSRILLSILAVLNSIVVWIISTRPPTSKSYSPFDNPLVTVPKAPITTVLIVTFMFHNFKRFLRFLLDCFVSSRFLVLLRYSLRILPFISICLIVSATKMPKYLYVSFSPSVLILTWFGSSIPSVICRLPLFITSMAHFSMSNSIPMSWLYILTVCIRVSSSFFLFCK